MNPEDMRLVTVCSKCMRVSCVEGGPMACNWSVLEESKGRVAEMVERSVAELRQLRLEHPRWWAKEVAS